MSSRPKIESIKGFHIEPTNLCTLKCPGCPRTRFIDQWSNHWKNYSLDINVLLQFLDIDLTGKQIRLCGNYGDPIYHPALIELILAFKQRGAHIAIDTNGSYKKEEWWEELANILDQDDNVTFSVDGIPDNFTQYRINADWESIHIAMKTIANSKCKSTWKYIPFAFNQNNIEEAIQLSQKIGISNFLVARSDRFDDQTENLKPTNVDLLGSRYNNQLAWKQNLNLSTVDAACANDREHFISANGFYSPCCRLADHRFYYKNIFGKNKEHYNINNTTITEILTSSQVIEFYKTLEETPACQFNCPNTAHNE